MEQAWKVNRNLDLSPKVLQYIYQLYSVQNHSFHLLIITCLKFYHYIDNIILALYRLIASQGIQVEVK